MVIILIGVYYSAQIFLIGAEFTWVYAHTFGSLRDVSKPGDIDPPAINAIPTRKTVPVAAAPIGASSGSA